MKFELKISLQIEKKKHPDVVHVICIHLNNAPQLCSAARSGRLIIQFEWTSNARRR